MTLACLSSRDAVALTLVANGTTTATVAVGVNHTPIERFAAETIQRHFRALTGQTPPLQVLPDEQLPPDTILVGTPNSHPAIEVANAVGELRLAGLGNEGYHIRLIRSGGSERVLIGANMATGALYGSVAFVEALIRRQTGLSPVDIDVEVSSVNALTLDTLDERSIPFYPIRATLEVEEVDWLGRHRVNVSGAEGVWSGTGNDDGIGAAFQYVLGYEQLQDRERFVRERTISQLQIRTRLLSERGIDSFLFMYLTGEPTNALISARPDLLGPAVLYGGARNGDFYRPFCWSNPDTLSLFADLSREIVRTYPDLSGFHLRAWGDETRACKCPLCGQNDAAGQELLWQIAYTVINAAREVRPDFRLLLSGYDQSWFQDPNFTHLNRLPPGSIVVQKWGGDGEPTIDPLIEPDLLRAVANSGHKLLVLSHDVEEVQPLWMLEGELFQQGVRRYADNPTIRGLGGFTLQGEIGMGLLDKRISAKVNWLPSVDVAAFTTNALSARYGSDAAPHLRDALFGNGRALSDFFTDYGGILTFTGGVSTRLCLPSESLVEPVRRAGDHRYRDDAGRGHGHIRAAPNDRPIRNAVLFDTGDAPRRAYRVARRDRHAVARRRRLHGDVGRLFPFSPRVGESRLGWGNRAGYRSGVCRVERIKSAQRDDPLIVRADRAVFGAHPRFIRPIEAAYSRCGGRRDRRAGSG
ncbi:MAG: alpha-glucuronidase family glycosyl hydrolase [Candidatus Poribacteria bacterium]|nr:alpha-glucuronidase family glycosyl hydrolase [Candidatus Poribacteria bacterium]